MKILTYEHDEVNLRGTCVPIKKEKPAYLNALINSMIDTMLEGKGVGLAAPQVGVNKRLFVAILDMERIEVFINPVILEHSEEMELDSEGCMSIPGKVGDVPRYKSVKIQYFNGKTMKKETFEGLNARIIQHEYDHLNGVLYIDKAENLRDREIASENTIENNNPALSK